MERLRRRRRHRLPGPTPYEDAAGVADMELVQKLRCRLDDETQYIIDRRLDHEASWAQIGAELDKTPNAAKKKYKSGLDRMQREFKQLDAACSSRLLRDQNTSAPLYR